MLGRAGEMAQLLKCLPGKFEDLNLHLQHSRKQMGIYIPAHLQLKCCGYGMVWLGRRETNRFLGFIGQRGHGACV